MHIYNTTFGVDPSVEAEFLEWLRQRFIPESTEDGEYFTSPELLKVLSGDSQANSFALHLRASSLDDINKWYEDRGAELFDHIMNRWQGRVVFFSTTLTSV